MLLELLLSLVEPSANNYSAHTFDLGTQLKLLDNQKKTQQNFELDLASNVDIDNSDCNKENFAESQDLAMILMQNYSRYLIFNFNSIHRLKKIVHNFSVLYKQLHKQYYA